MTTKETLHELIDSLSDHEAAELLARVRHATPPEPDLTHADPAGGKSVLEIFEEAWRNMAPEDLENWPSSDEVDKVVYRLHGD